MMSEVPESIDTATVDSVIAGLTPPLDHRKKVSYLPYYSDGKSHKQYMVMSRKIIIKPSFKLKTGVVKKHGREKAFERNVYVPGYEAFEILFCDGLTVWSGQITYDDNNVNRKKGNRDDTWSVEKFIPLIHFAIQYPEQLDVFHVKCTVEKDKEHGGGLLLKFKGKRTDGSWEAYITACKMSVVADDPKAAAHGDPIGPTKVFLDALTMNNVDLVRACRSNSMERAKALIVMSKGNISINATDEFSRWSILQWVCFNGCYDMCMWILTENGKIEVNYVSPIDGSTALHCAVSANNLEIVKLLIHHGASIYQTNFEDEKPSDLALRRGFKAIVEYFYDANSTLCRDGEKVHGVRNKGIVGMYVVLPPMQSQSDTTSKST